MLREERWLRIEQYIRDREFVPYADLLKVFNISKSTIYRDLEVICEEHADIVMARGGVMCVKETVTSEPTYSQKRTQNQQEKQRIAKAASELIRPRSTIYLDSGTTNREMIPFLLDMEDVNVITNDVMIAVELSKNTRIGVLVVGGQLRKGFFTLFGYEAERFLEEIRCDLAFMNMDAIDLTRGYMITNMDEVHMKQNAIQAANQAIVLCDHSKFESAAFISVCNFSSVDLLITDTAVPPEVVQRLQSKDIKLKLV